jgi:competence protein ComEA
VYRLPAGARVDDAVRRAGGVTAHADLDPVNLAAPVTDGQQVVVPRRGRAVAASVGGTPTSADAAATTPAAPLDLNTATEAQLETLDGVGPATAQKIIVYRQAHGAFKSVAELLDVSGIGPKKLAAMRASVRV